MRIFLLLLLCFCTKIVPLKMSFLLLLTSSTLQLKVNTAFNNKKKHDKNNILWKTYSRSFDLAVSRIVAIFLFFKKFLVGAKYFKHYLLIDLEIVDDLMCSCWEL